MRFKILGSGGALPQPIVLYFVAASIEAAFASGLNILDEVPECERVEITGPAHIVAIATRTPLQPA